MLPNFNAPYGTAQINTIFLFFRKFLNITYVFFIILAIVRKLIDEVMVPGLPHPGKVLDFFFLVLESPGILFISPGKYLEGFPVIDQDRM